LSHTVSRPAATKAIAGAFAVALVGSLLGAGHATADPVVEPAAWPTTWNEYTMDGEPVIDANKDESPAAVDIASGACGETCEGAGSVWYAATADTVFFRFRLADDPYTPAKNANKPGELDPYTYLVQLGTEAEGVLAVVGADGKADPDAVFVSNADGTETVDVHSGPFDSEDEGLRTVAVGDHFYLDLQVPLATLTEVSGVDSDTPVSLFFATGTDKNLDKIGKDLMTGSAVTFDDDDGITLEPPVVGNTGPTATDDVLELDEDTTDSVDVLANDTDIDADVLSLESITVAPTNGLAVPTGGTISYTPPADWNGSDSLTYEVCDATICDTATVAITVLPVNDAPVLTGPAAVVPVAHGGSTTSDLEVTDVDDDTFTFTFPTAPSKGTAVMNEDGTVTYTANAGAVGTDTFTVEACDPGGLCDTAVIEVLVAAVTVVDDGTIDIPVVEGPKTGPKKTVTKPVTMPVIPDVAVPAGSADAAGPVTAALDATARRGTLAATGSESVGIAGIGTLLIASGVLSVVLGRRRARVTTAS
jgi:hypothetical protein